MSDFDLYYPQDFQEDNQEIEDNNDVLQEVPCPGAEQVKFSCILLQTPVKEIKEFVDTNPNSYVLVPCTERGIFRLSRNIKSGYKVALIATLKDILK